MVDKTLADNLTRIAVQQLEAGVKLRQPRLDTIKKIEDLYNNKIVATIDNRINVPIPFMAGHIDTMHAKIDSRPTVNFEPIYEGDAKVAEKVTAAFRRDSSSMKGSWARKDRQEKKLALMSGRGISKIYSESPKGKYKTNYDVVDYHDFVCEGTQGHLEDMLYKGQMNIFRTPAELKTKAQMGFYDTNQVNILLGRTNDGNFKRNEDLYKNKINRLQSLGLDPESNGYIGQKVVNLTEWVMDYEGKSCYLVFDYTTGTWVRCDLTAKVFPSGEDYPNGLSPWISWATHDEAFAFWTKGFGDDVMPVAEAMRIIINQILNNTMRRNQPMRAVDPSVFPDPNELEWDRPDDLVVSNPGKDPRSGIYTFETPEISASINLAQYLDQFLGKKTGVTADAQGAADRDVKVGVYYGNVQQVADRIGAVEKNYNESYAEKGYRYWCGLREHMTESKLVKLIGHRGVQWDLLTKEEVTESGDLDLVVSGGSQEAELNAVKQKQQSEAIAAVTGNPEFAPLVSKKWIIENSFKLAGFTDEDIQRALDVEGDGNDDLMKEAAHAIELILDGKTPRLNRGANTAFLQKLLDFDADNLDYIKLDKNGKQSGIDKKMKDKSDRLRAYADAHYEIVILNMKRRAMMQAKISEQRGVQFNMPVPTPKDQRLNVLRPGEMPQGTAQGTAQMSQELTQAMA